MRRKDLLWISLVALLLTSVVMTGTVMSSSSARMYVDPAETTGMEPPATFTIDIKADVGVGAEPTCYGWDFILSFDPGLLQVPSHTEEDWKSDTWYGNGTQTTFQTTKRPVVPDSEMVVVNDTIMSKPDNYTIVYETGNITFTTAPGLDVEINALYQFSTTVYHVTSGHFLEETGWATAWGIGHVAPDVDNFNGLIGAGDAIMPDEATGELPPEGAYGTGKVLATIEFQVIGYGICVLELASTELATVVGEPPHQTFTPISHTVEHGLFDSRPYNLPPVADFNVEHPGMVKPVVGKPITFDASASYDNGTIESPAGWIVSYFWDFGDNTTDSGMVIDHTFAEVGTYTVSLTVTDNDGANDTATTTIEVVEWMEGGEFPDLIEECAWPEHVRYQETSRGPELELFGLVGNPTEDDYEVYVEFTIYGTEEAKKLGTITTDTVIIHSNETLGSYEANTSPLNATMDLRETRWRVAPDQAPYWAPKYLNWAKYTAFARCYYRLLGDGDFKKALVAKDFGYEVHPSKADIAVLEVTTDATNGVPQGSLLKINVTVQNECSGGKYPRVFNITVTYKGFTTPETFLGVTSAELKGKEITTETFTLDTTGMTTETYLITATLTTLTYERDTTDNRGSCVIDII